MNLDLDRALSEDEIIERGRRAAALMENDLIRDALAGIVQQATDDFHAAEPHDEAALRNARYLADAAQRFGGIFQTWIMQGRNAASKAELEEKEIV